MSKLLFASEISVDDLIVRLQTTADAFVTITKELDLNKVLQSIACTAQQVGNSSYSMLSIFDEQGQINTFYTSGTSPQQQEMTALFLKSCHLLGLFIKEGHSLRIHDLSLDPRFCAFPPKHPLITSFLGVPVSSQGKIIGILYLMGKIGAAEFDETDEWLLNLFARQAAIAIENAKLYDKNSQAQRNAQTLAELIGSLNEFTEPNPLFQQISNAVCQILDLPAAGVFLLDRRSGRFTLQKGVGLRQSPVGDTFVPIEGSLAGKVLAGGETLIVPDTGLLDRAFMPSLANGILPKSVVVVPIRKYGKINGVIEAYSKEARHFTPDETGLLETFATKASLALEKAYLYQHKEDFLSMTAHDLRTPLTAIKMSMGLLTTNLPPDFPPLLSQLFENVSRNAQRLDDLMVDLLDLTRLENGGVHLKLEQCEVGKMIRGVTTTLGPLFEEKSQILKSNFNGEECWIEVDRRRMEQVLVNLLVNANKYTLVGGKVEIGLAEIGDLVRIEIKDNGPGIPLSEQELIFDRYYRRPVHEEGVNNSGTGLGLPITRKLVELQGGKIRVESAPGQGTTFYVEMPLHDKVPVKN